MPRKAFPEGKRYLVPEPLFRKARRVHFINIRPEDGAMQAFAHYYDEIEARQDSPGCPGDTTCVQPRTVHVVDDDYFARSAVRAILQDTDCRVVEFSSCESFLAAHTPDAGACLVLDVHFPGMGGLQLLERLRALSRPIPVVVMSGSSRIREAVVSIKIGACDFLEKPLAPEELRTSIANAFRQLEEAMAISSIHQSALDRIADLTPRQREILRLVLAGQPSKNIAADLGISQRTVESHRASIMHKTGVRSLPALARLVLSSAWRPDKMMVVS